ncbi:hypothetical protein OVA24_05490 [Luteolibacter sp. SL250]|uniref:hypothetical protein n=1 Tax=Luteolibacter sp. SL250 TaxID=2995170 RepID=UPI002270C156|nr:hypothetical protein [Luteolibacter sp. SL250]WAC20835.1 hypothetical protein OVA24_05490 [Luteolibacter sp. SL250]
MKFSLLLALFSGGIASGATLLTDNFESGSVSTDWSVNKNATVTAGGPVGSTNYAAIGPYDPVTNGQNWGGLGKVFSDGGVASMMLDVDFRLKGTDRQFNLNVSTYSTTPNGNDAAINLIYTGSNWQVHNGTSFVTLSGLMAVTANSWYHMTLETVGWGSNGATYNITISDGVTSSTVTGLTTRQAGNINTATVRSFIFNSRYGNNPGFDIDNLVVSGTVIPEPSALFLALAAAPLFMRRSRAI